MKRVRLRSRRDPVTIAALLFVILLVGIGLFGTWFPLKDPNAQDLTSRMLSPRSRHLLGTDNFGRDTLSRLVEATPVTLLAALRALVVAVLLGVPLGLLAGYFRGILDSLLSRLNDAMLCLPALILAFAIIGALGPGLSNAMLAVGVVLSPRFFRLARASALSIRELVYVEAARSVGCSTWRILGRYVLPNSSGPLIVEASFALGAAISAESSLSFLGLGVRPPAATWGGMVKEAFDAMATNAFPIFPPSIIIVATVLTFSLLGDKLRDLLSGVR